MTFFLKSLKDLKRVFIHFIHKSQKTSKMLDHTFGLSARGSKQKKLIVSLLEFISVVSVLMDINVTFGGN